MAPLHFAYQKGSMKMIDYLVKKGAKGDTKTKYSLAPKDAPSFQHVFGRNKVVTKVAPEDPPLKNSKLTSLHNIWCKWRASNNSPILLLLSSTLPPNQGLILVSPIPSSGGSDRDLNFGSHALHGNSTAHAHTASTRNVRGITTAK
jgi:hypothetical protein